MSQLRPEPKVIPAVFTAESREGFREGPAAECLPFTALFVWQNVPHGPTGWGKWSWHTWTNANGAVGVTATTAGGLKVEMHGHPETMRQLAIAILESVPLGMARKVTKNGQPPKPAGRRR